MKESNKFCCDAFKHLIPFIKWGAYQDDDGNNRFTLAHIGSFHLNHCPSCGKSIRGIELTEEEYDQYHLNGDTKTI